MIGLFYYSMFVFLHICVAIAVIIITIISLLVNPLLYIPNNSVALRGTKGKAN